MTTESTETKPRKPRRQIRFKGKEMRRIRIQNLMSQRYLAKHAGVGVATIYRLENGETEAAWLQTIQKLARVLRVKPDKLYEIVDD